MKETGNLALFLNETTVITRRQLRWMKREEKSRKYHINGLNGSRAMARRKRQMENRRDNIAE